MRHDMVQTEEPGGKPQDLSLPHGRITYDSAKDRETNILQEIRFAGEKQRFFDYLEHSQGLISATVARHLRVSTHACKIDERKYWIYGSFNVCINVWIDRGPDVLIRFPLPFQIKEDICPGNADEKVRCEVAMYVWLQENCPDVPIPFLYGFGVSKAQGFTHTNNLNIISRNVQSLRWKRSRAKQLPLLSDYTRTHDTGLCIPYILLEYVDSDRGEPVMQT
ncbi:hypothetical protein ANO11243_031460 [Dothideomycetidae sp. 11243]|nr:hypothetical protein ANO11243_031460 [fungal sp. No.11243]